MSHNKLAPRPDDPRLFGEPQLPALQSACEDLSYLRTRGYANGASLKLVGDRYQLSARPRRAVSAASCSDDARAHRIRTRLDLPTRLEPNTPQHTAHQDASTHAPILIDGYNLLITLATAHACGPLFRGRGGALRDLAGLHGAYKPGPDTVTLLGDVARVLGSDRPVRWLLDQPISASGKLARLINDTADTHGWPWRAETVPDPDPIMQASTQSVLITSDAAILDAATAWIDLATPIIAATVDEPWIIDWWN